MSVHTESYESIDRLTRDLRDASRSLGRDEARFLVDAYYAMQEQRKRASNQLRALVGSGEPHAVLSWLSEQSQRLEGQVARALDAYSDADPLGVWARSVVGIGPVIAAGLLAHIDLEKAPTAGSIWRFAGLDPSAKWEKGQKRPWNAFLKVLCWKIGESFVKTQNHKNSFYGPLLLERKALEQSRSDSGECAAQAAAILKEKRISKTTEAHKHYSEGRLPPAQIHARAKRWAVKLFLSHYHEVGRTLLGLPVPETYPIAHLGHAHRIPPPQPHGKT